MTMKVIGVDPSLTATGICDTRGQLLVVGGPAKHGDTRLAFIHQEIERICQRQKPDLAVIEDLPKHAQAAGITGMVQGVVRLALVREHVPYVRIVASTLKKYATGRGNAEKSDLRMALFRRAGIDERDDNLVDAWWLRHMGLDRLGEPVIALPAVQRACLDVPDWPEIAQEATA